MTPADRAGVAKMIKQAILEERERTAAAAGMTSSGCSLGELKVARAFRKFAQELREQKK